MVSANILFIAITHCVLYWSYISGVAASGNIWTSTPSEFSSSSPIGGYLRWNSATRASSLDYCSSVSSSAIGVAVLVVSVFISGSVGRYDLFDYRISYGQI